MIRNVAEASIKADPVARTIVDRFPADHPEGWTGTPSELLSVLNTRVSDGVRKSLLWPSTAGGLGSRINRIAPLLRSRGFVVERRHSGQRFIAIVPTNASPPQ
jgi:putative DNA primase/helicase